MWRASLARGVHLVAQIVLGSSTLCIVFWLLYAGTRSYHLYSSGAYYEPHVFKPPPACTAAIKNALSPTFNTCQEEKVLFSHLLFLWLLPAVMALSAIALLASRAQARNQAPTGVLVKCTSRLAAPRQFWMKWCGGLTLGDILIAIAWLIMNALWLYAIISRNKSLQVVKLARHGWAHSASTKAKLLGKSLGMLLYPNLVLLFLPVSRGSAILQATGISYPAAIKYHRWLGHAVLWIVAIHSMLYYAAWLHDGQWLTEVVEQEPNVNKLMGSISFIFALILWVSSLEVVRRRHYHVFKTLHHICFWGFLLFGCAHSWSMVWYFLPGLMLAGVDAVYRITQAVLNSSKHGNVQVLHATASPDGALASLVIAAKGYAVPASGFVWLCVPNISKAEWHPFTYIAVPWEVPGSTSGTPGSTAVPESASSTCTAMLVQIKAYNRWSKKLVELVSSSGSFDLKVQGPYAEMPEAVQGHGLELVAAAGSGGVANKGSQLGIDDQLPLKAKGVIIVAGGLGIAPAMSLFQELQLSTAALPLLFVWSCRKAEELQFLAPRVMAMLQTLSPRALLTTELYITGAVPDQLDDVTEGVSGTTTSRYTEAVPVSSDAGATSSGPHLSKPAVAPYSAGATHSGSKASIVTTNLSPVLNFGSYYAQAVYHFMVHVVVFGATFIAIVLARYISTSLPSQPWPTDKMGAVYVILIAAFILIPGTILSLLAHKLLSTAVTAAKPATIAAADITELDREKSAHGSSATACATASAAAAAAVAANIQGRLVWSADNSTTCTGSTAHPCDQPKAMLQLHLPAAALGDNQTSHSKHSLVAPVKLGRPPLEHIINSWLAGVHHLPAADAATLDQFVVHAMGPEKLVQDVQLLCDDVNRRSTQRCGACRKPGRQAAGVQTYLHFVRRSHDL